MPRSSNFVGAAALAVVVVLATPSASVSGATLNVCPSGCTYSLPSQANAAMQAGDEMTIQPGTYTDCFSLQVDDAKITGVLDANGKRPTITGRVCGGKGAIVTYGKRATIKNLELSYSSCASGDANCAGIRHDAASFDLTLDNMWIHHNDDGLLGSATGDTITITNSLFEDNGLGGQAHNMYFGHHANVIFRNSISRHSVGSGHIFKTRASRTEIDQSILASLGTGSEGTSDSRQVDCSNGGQLIITNSIIEKSAHSENNDWISYAPEGLSNTAVSSMLVFTNNIVINDKGTGPVLNMGWSKPATVTINNNTLVATSDSQFHNYGTATNTISYASRAAAGYGAYPALPDLPPLQSGSGGTTPGGNGGGSTPSNPPSSGNTASTGPARDDHHGGDNDDHHGSTGSHSGGGDDHGGDSAQSGGRGKSAAHVKIAFTTMIDQVTDAWKASIAAQTCAAIGLPAARCTVLKVEAGSVVATVQITGPSTTDTTGTTVTVDQAVAAIKTQMLDSTSPLRTSSAYTSVDTSKAVTSVTVDQCADGSYQSPCPSGAVNSASSLTSSVTMVGAAVLAIAALFAGVM